MKGEAPFRRLVAECLRDRARLGGAALTLVGAGACQLALTWIVKLWLSRFESGRGETADLVGAAVLVTCVFAAMLLSSRLLLASLSQRLLSRLRRAAADRLLAVRVADARAHPTGDLLARVFNDGGALGGFVETLLKRVAGDGLVACGALVLMFTLSWKLALGGALLAPSVGILLARFGRRIRRLGAAAQRESGALSGLLLEQMRGLTTVKGYQTEDFERARFADGDARLQARVLASERWAALLTTVVFTATGLALVAGIVWGSRAAKSGELSAASLLAFCLYAAQTIEPLRRLSDVHGMLQRSLASAERVFELVDLAGDERPGSVALPSPPRGELRLERVRFRHRPDVPLLEGVDLSLEPGETAAIVAASGGGKSTLASLLTRHLSPLSGRVLLDGVDAQDARLSDLRRAVCVVEQEPFLFSGPLLENVRYGSFDADRRDVEAAVDLAGLRDVAASLPRGIDTPMQEAGRELSGGEKQRIALARAIVRDPKVLVLDEATSALDGEAEELIFERLAGWLSRRTVLVMAHRLSTVARFPRVVVLERGRVVGDGPALELLASCPPFAQLFAGQVEPMALRA